MQVGDEPVRFAALDGLFLSILGRGQLREAHELVQQQVALAEQLGEMPRTFRSAWPSGHCPFLSRPVDELPDSPGAEAGSFRGSIVLCRASDPVAASWFD